MSTFRVSNQRMPGLNWEAPPLVRDLEFVFDEQFAGEQRARLQVMMAGNKTVPAYGIVDEQNPNTASAGAVRPLVVQPNDGNPLYIDVKPGWATTKAGNIIEIPEQISGIPLATTTRDILCVVLLEYVVVDDPDTNVATDYGTVEAVRRTAGPSFDINQIDSNPSLLDSSQNVSTNAIKVVLLTTFADPSKFSPERLNDCVVLGLVKIVQDSETPSTEILYIDMTNNVSLNVPNMQVRPWFSPVDQQHRAGIGTGTVTDTNVHGLGFNDLSAGELTLYQQALQHGIVLSRDLDVPGCPGKLCTEFVDSTRVLTDDGTYTGTNLRKYVRLTSYPAHLLGIRANMLDGADSVPNTSLGAHVLGGEIIPGTNVLALGYYNATSESYDPALGFTVYYTSSDASRPPALPSELMLATNNTIQFQQPASTELLLTGGKAYPTNTTTTFSMANAGPFQKQYRVWLDGSLQYIASPQVVHCSKLIEGATGVGTAVQTPQFAMYGPAKLRVGLWNAPLPVAASLFLSVELVGTGVDGSAITEVVTISGTAGTAVPRQVAWLQPNPVPAIGVDPAVYQITTNVFATLTSWRVTSKNGIGANGLVQVWADLEPTTTPALRDALPVTRVWWNGQSCTRFDDIRPITKSLHDVVKVGAEGMSIAAATLALTAGVTDSTVLVFEDFKNPRWQDNVLSRRDRHNDSLNSVAADETLPAFETDGTANANEWYYSRPIMFPATQDSMYIVMFGSDKSGLLRQAFGTDAVLEFQVAAQAAPSTYSNWIAATQLAGSTLERRVILSIAHAPITSPYSKVRFRVLGKDLRGYAVLFRSV